MEQTEDNEKNIKLENRLDELFIKKRRITDTLLTINTAYSQIDDIFAREIILAEIQKKNKFLFQINSIFKIICCPIKGCLKNYDTMFIPTEYIKINSENNLLDKINIGNISEIYKTLGIDYIEKKMGNI